MPPPSIRTHDIGAGCPSIAPCIASWKFSSAALYGSRSTCPWVTPMPSSASDANSPRADGSAASWPRNGCASMVCSINASSAGFSRNSRPCLSKYGDASGRRTDRKCALSVASASASPAAVWSVISGELPSITATIKSWNCGNARSNAIERCRQGSRSENILSVSVLTPSIADDTAPDSKASRMPPSTMATACRRLYSTRRTRDIMA